MSQSKNTRVSQILDLITQIAAGNLQSRAIPSPENDELDAMLTGLNTLAEKLDASQGSLRQAHDELESRAHERTAQLTRAVEILEAEIERRKRMAERQTTLYEVLRAVSGQLDSQAVVHLAVETIVRVTHCPHVCLAMLSQDGTHWMTQGTGGRLAASLGMTCSFDQGIIGRTFKTGCAQVVPDVRLDPDYVFEGGGDLLLSEVTAPLRRGGRILGVLNMESDRPAAFDAADALLAESLADVIALALENARLYEAAQVEITERKRAESCIAAYAQLGQRFNAAVTPQEAAHIIVRVADQLLKWDACIVDMYSPEDDKLHLILQIDTLHGERVQAPAKDHLKPSHLERRVLEEGALLIFQEQEHPMPGLVMFGDTSRHSASIMFVPICHSNGGTSFLSIQSYTPHAYTLDDLGTLQTLADYCAVALDRLWAEAALRENEERYRLLFQEATEGIGLFDAKTGIIMDCNQALVELVGRKKSELVGQPQEILYSPKASPGQVSRTLELHRGEKAGQVLETQVVTRTGEIRDVEIKASLLDLRGKPVLQGIFRDITQQKQAEQALRRYNAELQTHNEELDAFAHTVAHDLKNPLGSLMGFADTLAAYHETMPDEEQSACMKAILRNGQRMSNIIDELLLLASVRKEDVTLVPLDMSELVAEARHRVDYIVKDRSIRFIVPLASAWPPAVGHAPWVEEVWVNYLSNAIKYGAPPPETHQSLHIELGAEVLPNGMVRFWVRDNGRGLTPDEQARLFAPFTQLQQVRAKGHGLGLSIVRRIVEKLGGQVAVESEGVPGKGSLFSFTLPAAVVSSDPKSLSER